MVSGTARRTAVLSLLAIVPAVLYALDQGEYGVWLSVLSVVLIAGCVFFLLGGRTAGPTPTQ